MVRRRGSDADCGEFGLDGSLETLTDLGDGDLVDDLVEETAHDESPCRVLGDSAGAQVEQLLVVETSELKPW